VGRRSAKASLTPAQRREILAADPETGELRGRPAVLAALRDKGLAVAYGRVGAHYLTEAGRSVRAELLAGERPDERPAAGTDGPDAGAEGPAAPSGPGTFAAATGDGPETGEDPRRRADAVARAWDGVLEIRRVVGGAGAAGTAVPAPWERTRMVWAVALALEAAGVPPSAVDPAGRRTREGYRVLASDEPGAVRVEWRGPAASGARQRAGRRLEACARHLAGRGWEALPYLGAGRVPFLLVTPAAP